MFHLFKAKEPKRLTYDKENQKPVIRCSICTGEQEAGFKDRVSGKFTGERLIHIPDDLKAFLRDYDIEEKELRREW